MSKKQLNEVRRFMKLANLNGNITSNFVNRLAEDGALYDREDDLEDDALEVDALDIEDEVGSDVEGLEDLGGEEMADELAMDAGEDFGDTEGVDISDEAARAIIDLGQQLESVMDGMEGELEDEVGDLEDEYSDLEGDEAMIDDEADALEGEEDEMDVALAEMINSILQEDDDEGLGDADDDDDDEGLEETKRGQRRKTARPAFKKNESRKRKAKVRQESRKRRAKPRKESIEIVDDDKLIKEVSQRVKKRLAQIARARSKKRRQ